MVDIIIVGAGASGLMAAISASRANKNKMIAIIEKNHIVGKKIYATGNGKCNLTNMSCKNAKETVAFFNSIGLLTKELEEGRVYPYSEQAKDVVAILENQLRSDNIDILINSEVTNVAKVDGIFEVEFTDKTKKTSNKLIGRNLIIATGGKSYPIHGSIGDGYRFSRTFGHTTTPLVPALTGIECKGDFLKLKGIRANAKLSILKKQNIVFEEKGQIQFTEYGLSGIVTFNGSHKIEKNVELFSIAIDFVPDLTETEVIEMLEKRKNIKNFKTEFLLTSIVDERLARIIYEKVGLDSLSVSNTVDTKRIEVIAKFLKNVTFQVKGLRGWKEAQITKGGIKLDEVDMETMESQIVENLYFVGEILDIQGYCGGYNLQNAWETGLRVGNNFEK